MLTYRQRAHKRADNLILDGMKAGIAKAGRGDTTKIERMALIALQLIEGAVASNFATTASILKVAEHKGARLADGTADWDAPIAVRP